MKKMTAGILLACTTVFGSTVPQLAIQKNPEVPDQNITLGAAMQMFGSYLAVVKGGAMLSQSQTFYLATERGGVTNTANFVLVNKDGAIIAGPVDPEYLYEGNPLAEIGSITFTNTIALPEGTNALFLKGRAKALFPVNTRVVTGTGPRLWTVTDLLNGVTLPQTDTTVVIGQTMTVRGPTLTVSFSSGERTAIAGERQTVFGEYTLDATASSEDIRVVAIPGDYRFNEGNGATDLTNISLYDGATAITTGSNVRNPSGLGAQTLTLDGTGLIVPKGTIKIIQQKADIRSSITTGTYEWSVWNVWGDEGSAFRAVGLASANAAAVMVAPTSGTFTLNVIPHGEVVITQEYTPSISEQESGTRFFALSVMPTYEDFAGGVLTLGVMVSPANQFQLGNGLAHPRLKSGTVSIESVLIPFQVKGDITSYLVSFNLMQGFVFYQNIKTELQFTVEYDNALQTGDEVSVFIAGNNPTFVGSTSGALVTPLLPAAGNEQTVVIRRIQADAPGDVNGDGKIDANDLVGLQIIVARQKDGGNRMPLFPALNTFPDSVIDEWDVVALDAYLKGIFLTLPVGDVNYDWKLTTLDIALARQGILGQRLLRNFQIRQGDINASGGVTTLDIILMRRLILGLGIGR